MTQKQVKLIETGILLVIAGLLLFLAFSFTRTDAQTTANLSADLEVTVDDGVTQVDAGTTSHIFNIVVENTSGDTIESFILDTDATGATETISSATQESAGATTTNFDTSTGVWQGSLPEGQQIIFTALTSVNPIFSEISLTASVDDNGSFSDPTTSNNSDTDSSTVVRGTTANSDTNTDTNTNTSGDTTNDSNTNNDTTSTNNSTNGSDTAVQSSKGGLPNTAGGEDIGYILMVSALVAVYAAIRMMNYKLEENH